VTVGHQCGHASVFVGDDLVHVRSIAASRQWLTSGSVCSSLSMLVMVSCGSAKEISGTPLASPSFDSISQVLAAEESLVRYFIHCVDCWSFMPPNIFTFMSSYLSMKDDGYNS
jgi:hypothetical protein